MQHTEITKAEKANPLMYGNKIALLPLLIPASFHAPMSVTRARLMSVNTQTLPIQLKAFKILLIQCQNGFNAKVIINSIEKKH